MKFSVLWSGLIEGHPHEIKYFTSRLVCQPAIGNRLLQTNRGTQRQFSENICSEDDLRSRIFGRFVVKFLACLPLLEFSNI